MTKRLTVILSFGLVVFVLSLPGCGEDKTNTKSQSGIAAPKDAPKVVAEPTVKDLKSKSKAGVGELFLPDPPKGFKKPN